MRYADPAGLFTFRYPVGWAYAPERSSTETAILEHFKPEIAALRVDVFPHIFAPRREPRAWSAAMATELSDRLGIDIALRLLPDEETASGIERDRSERQARRLVAFRGDPVDVAVTVTSAGGQDGPFMIDTIRLARSSFRRQVLPAGQADRAGRLLGLVWDAWGLGRPPPTSKIVAAALAIREQAVAESAPDPLFGLDVLLGQQLNTVEQAGDDEPAARLLRGQIAQVRSAIAGLFRGVGLPEPPLGDPAEVALAGSELIRRLHEASGPSTPLETAVLHDQALAGLLTHARGGGGTLRRLWDVMSAPEQADGPQEDVLAEVLDGVGWTASVLAESSFDLGERADCHDADELASAALRLLFARQPDGTLGGTPVRTQLQYRLLTSSIHRRADGDPLSIEEANRLREEVAGLDPSGQLSLLHDREDQRIAFDNMMLLANLAADDPLTGPMTATRQAQMVLALGDEQQAFTAFSAARQQLGQLTGPPGPAAPASDRLDPVGDLYLDLAEVASRLGRTREALDLLGQGLAHTAPIVSPSSFHLMRVAAQVYADQDAALATRWADGAAVIAEGLRLSTRPGEDRVRFIDSLPLQDSYNEAIAGHLRAGDRYAAISMADRSRGRFLAEGLGSGDKSLSMGERLVGALPMTGPPAPPALGGPTNAILSIEPLAEALGRRAPPIPAGLPRDLDARRTALLTKVAVECAFTRTPVPLSPARIAGLSLPLRNVLMIQESGEDLILFLLGVGDVPPGLDGDQMVALMLAQPRVRHTLVPGCRRRLLEAMQAIQQWMGIHASTRWYSGDQQPATQTAFDSALAVVSELIIKPVAPHLEPTAELTIIPSRGLGLVPWGLLTASDGRFLVDHHAITIVPSLSIMNMLFERRMRAEPGPLRAYIAADPPVDTDDFDPLPYAREEAGVLAGRLAKLGAGPYVCREGPDATAMSYWLEAAGASLVHLSAHAELAYPAESSVIHLGGGGLAAYEAADVPLSSAVVFLSACDTGQGRVSSDGVLGLGQNFLQAGAQAVVLTLTQVIDSVTAALGGHFYAALLDRSSKLTVAEALQTAILATRSDLEKGLITQDGKVVTADTRRWGAFYVLGHPDARLNLDNA
jgi:CHAT domain-containing protein